jgi:cytochrome o ubiquinol oxidase subunit IV
MTGQVHTQVATQAARRDYAVGFLLSVLLTAVPFWFVIDNVTGSKAVTALVIVALAAVQMVVHVLFFLHVSRKSEGGWTLVSLIFTLMIVFIALGGSLWVMEHLDSNMVPAHEVSEQP